MRNKINNMFAEGIVTRNLKLIRQAEFELEQLQEEEDFLEIYDYCDLREDISTFETCAW
jgi:hypothetical protein